MAEVYSVYAAGVKSDTKELVVEQIVIPAATVQASRNEAATKVLTQDYPNNCADQIKATQELLIVGCSENGEVVIFHILTSQAIVFEKGSASKVGADNKMNIQVLELYGQKTRESMDMGSKLGLKSS